ncbi:Rnf-Nqr domain containing protein [Pseudomonas sp.]|uniref:Rnf-Nqr domain containing protein n=1 Tax=Pseudomonas sp. TaxID=306 RepID=UPI0025846301|nr:Rnf-Nqr domain containing protein [Pseudomonas sp.]
MTRAVGLANAALLAPLLGVTDTLPKALSFLALSALTVTLYGLVMRAVRSRLSASLRLGASLMVAATLVSCVQLLLQAFALPLYQQLGIYLALISVQCVVLEHRGFFEAGQRKAQLRLVGLFAALMLVMGLLRASAATTLMPAGFILLGLLLAGLQAWAHFSQSR